MLVLQEYAALLRDGVKLSSFPNAAPVLERAAELYYDTFSDRRVKYSEFFPLEGPMNRTTSASRAGCHECDTAW